MKLAAVQDARIIFIPAKLSLFSYAVAPGFPRVVKPSSAFSGLFWTRPKSIITLFGGIHPTLSHYESVSLRIEGCGITGGRSTWSTCRNYRVGSFTRYSLSPLLIIHCPPFPSKPPKTLNTQPAVPSPIKTFSLLNSASHPPHRPIITSLRPHNSPFMLL